MLPSQPSGLHRGVLCRPWALPPVRRLASPRCLHAASRALGSSVRESALDVYIHSHFLRFGEPRFDGADMMRTEPSRVSLPGQKSPQALPWEVPGGRYRPQIRQAVSAVSSVMPRSVSLSSCPVCFPARGRRRRWPPVELPGGAVMNAQPGVRPQLFVCLEIMQLQMHDFMLPL